MKVTPRTLRGQRMSRGLGPRSLAPDVKVVSKIGEPTVRLTSAVVSPMGRGSHAKT